MPCALVATALSSQGRTLPVQGDVAQPPRLTPPIAEEATAHPLLLDNSRETSTKKRQKREEKEGAHQRKTSPTPLPRELERDARGLEKQSGQGWITRRSGLLALWPLGCGTSSCLLFSDTELSLSFSELLVATCGVQTLERRGKHNSSRHATSLVTTEACIVAHAGRATLSPAPANCVLLLLSLVFLPVRSCPSARAEYLTCLRLCSWRQGGVFSPVPSRKAEYSKARSST